MEGHVVLLELIEVYDIFINPLYNSKDIMWIVCMHALNYKVLRPGEFWGPRWPPYGKASSGVLRLVWRRCRRCIRKKILCHPRQETGFLSRNLRTVVKLHVNVLGPTIILRENPVLRLGWDTRTRPLPARDLWDPPRTICHVSELGPIVYTIFTFYLSEDRLQILY